MLNTNLKKNTPTKTNPKRLSSKRVLLLTLCATLGLSQVTPTHAFDWDRLSFNQKAGVCAVGVALLGAAIYGLYRLCRTTDQEVINQCQRLLNRANRCYESREEFARLYRHQQSVPLDEETLERLDLSVDYVSIAREAKNLRADLAHEIAVLNERAAALRVARAKPSNRADANVKMDQLLQQMESINEQWQRMSPKLIFIQQLISRNQNYFLLQRQYASVQHNYANIIAQQTFDFTQLSDTELRRLGLLPNYNCTIRGLIEDLYALRQSAASVAPDRRLAISANELATNLTPKLDHLREHTDFFALRRYHSEVVQTYRNILDDNNFNPEHLRLSGDYTAIIAYNSNLGSTLETLEQKLRAVPQAELRETAAATINSLRAKLEQVRTSDRYQKAVIRRDTTEAAYAAGKTAEVLYQTFKPKNKDQEDNPDADASAAAAIQAARNRDAAIRAAAELAGIAAAATHRRK